MMVRKSQPIHLICNSVCSKQVLFIQHFNCFICRIRSIYRKRIRNLLNIVMFTGWFLWKQEMRLSLTIRTCQERRQGWAEREVEQPQKHNKLQLKSLGKLCIHIPHQSYSVLGRNGWICIRFNQSLDRDGHQMGRQRKHV